MKGRCQLNLLHAQGSFLEATPSNLPSGLIGATSHISKGLGEVETVYSLSSRKEGRSAVCAALAALVPSPLLTNLCLCVTDEREPPGSW